jgi:hypothetical protein
MYEKRAPSDGEVAITLFLLAMIFLLVDGQKKE